MKKFKINVDIDSIIADTLPHWLEAIHKETGVRALESDITQWDMAKCAPLDTLDMTAIFKHLQTPDFMRTIPVMPGAREGLKMLQEDGHEILLLTARHGPVSMPETLEWVREHFPFLNGSKQVAFIYDKHRISGDILIDDKAETLWDYGRVHPQALLMTVDYAYNRDCPPGTVRVPRDIFSWVLLTDKILSAAKG